MSGHWLIAYKKKEEYIQNKSLSLLEMYFLLFDHRRLLILSLFSSCSAEGGRGDRSEVESGEPGPGGREAVLHVRIRP